MFLMHGEYCKRRKLYSFDNIDSIFTKYDEADKYTQVVILIMTTFSVTLSSVLNDVLQFRCGIILQHKNDDVISSSSIK